MFHNFSYDFKTNSFKRIPYGLLKYVIWKSCCIQFLNRKNQVYSELRIYIIFCKKLSRRYLTGLWMHLWMGLLTIWLTSEECLSLRSPSFFTKGASTTCNKLWHTRNTSNQPDDTSLGKYIFSFIRTTMKVYSVNYLFK